MAAIETTEDDYLPPEHSAWQGRIVWLMVLMVSATITGNIIGHFQAVLHSTIGLTVFIPMLMGTGGNAGAQSSTLIIRGMAVGELKRRDTFRILFKELRVSLVVGAALGFTNFVRIILFEGESISIALIVSITVFLTIVLAKLTGSLLPIIARSVVGPGAYSSAFADHHYRCPGPPGVFQYCPAYTGTHNGYRLI